MLFFNGITKKLGGIESESEKGRRGGGGYNKQKEKKTI